jgi:hypothetical protein
MWGFAFSGSPETDRHFSVAVHKLLICCKLWNINELCERCNRECSCFVGEVGASVASPRKKMEPSHPSASPTQSCSVQRDTPATDSRHHLVTLKEQLRSVLKSSPGRATGVFGGTDDFVYVTASSPFGKKRPQDNSLLILACL